MSLRRRLFLAQAPLGVALALVGYASVQAVSYLAERPEKMLRDNYQSSLAALSMISELDRMDQDILLRAAGATPSTPASARRDRFESELRLQTANITEAGEAEATARLEKHWKAYLRSYQAALTDPHPLAAYAGPLAAAGEGVRAAAAEIVALNKDAMVRKGSLARTTSREFLQFTLAAGLAALAVGIVASAALTARVVRPVSALTRAVQRFGEGDLGARVRTSGGDEIAILGREFDTMADRLEKYRKSSLSELIRAQQAAQAAIDSLPDPILVLDPAGVVQSLNAAGVTLLRVNRQEEAIGRRFEVLDTGLRQRIETVCAQVLAGRGPYAPRGLDEAVRVDLPEGPRRFLPRASALLGGGGEPVGVTIVLQDVTRLILFDELRNDLVATVAHEFRTPLTSLQMAVHMCVEGSAGSLNDAQADLLQGARQDCNRLQSIVKDILDVSRIQRGHLTVEPRSVDARALTRRAVASAEASALSRSVSLVEDVPKKALAVHADPERIDVVLANLVANAVRHSAPQGRVVVRAMAVPSGVRLEVEDAGEGIPAEHQERIFERFYQVPGERRGGVGLGLYISREIVRAHGGAIGVDSSPGSGSRFWFTLPVDGGAPTTTA